MMECRSFQILLRIEPTESTKGLRVRSQIKALGSMLRTGEPDPKQLRPLTIMATSFSPSKPTVSKIARKLDREKIWLRKCCLTKCCRAEVETFQVLEELLQRALLLEIMTVSVKKIDRATTNQQEEVTLWSVPMAVPTTTTHSTMVTGSTSASPSCQI